MCDVYEGVRGSSHLLKSGRNFLCFVFGWALRLLFKNGKGGFSKTFTVKCAMICVVERAGGGDRAVEDGLKVFRDS